MYCEPGEPPPPAAQPYAYPMSAAEHPTRRSQALNSAKYDRVARFYRSFEPLYLIFPPARRRAVAALRLKPGDVVLEIGAGTGRNFPYLVRPSARPAP